MDSFGSSGSEGHLVFTYRPVPVTPMSLALLILLGIVTFVLGPIASPPELWPIGGLCFLPFSLLALFVPLRRPSPTRIAAEGVEVSPPLWGRLPGARPHFPGGAVVPVDPPPRRTRGWLPSRF